MNYPNFKNKHTEKSLVSPKQVIGLSRGYEKVPEKMIITTWITMWKYFRRNYKYKKVPFSLNIPILKHKDVGFLVLRGTGSPNATSRMEELIALGCKEVIIIGAAGGLKHEGVFLCNKALRDEGTSHHYLAPGKFVYPDKSLTKRLEKSIKKLGLKYFKGATWTTDALYRETRAEVERYSKQGISTVDMEASALFAVGKYRKIKVAAVFSVTDLLGLKWKPFFKDFNVKRVQGKIVDIAMNCFLNK